MDSAEAPGAADQRVRGLVRRARAAASVHRLVDGFPLLEEGAHPLGEVGALGGHELVAVLHRHRGLEALGVRRHGETFLGHPQAHGRCCQHFLRQGFGGGFQVQQAVPGSLELMLPLVELDLGQRDPFIAIHLLGGSVQKFASSLKHQSVKAALGLPRSIDMNPKHPLHGPKGDRHAAPVQYHLFLKNGRYAVRVTALPVPTLRKLEESTTVLGNLLESLKTDLPQRVAGFKPARLNAAPQRFSGPKHVNVPSAPVDKTEEGELLAEKTKKLGWMVRGLSSDRSGPIVNTKEVPPEAQPGTVVKVKLVSTDPKNPSFRYLKP